MSILKSKFAISIIAILLILFAALFYPTVHYVLKGSNVLSSKHNLASTISKINYLLKRYISNDNSIIVFLNGLKNDSYNSGLSQNAEYNDIAWLEIHFSEIVREILTIDSNDTTPQKKLLGEYDSTIAKATEIVRREINKGSLQIEIKKLILKQGCFLAFTRYKMCAGLNDQSQCDESINVTSEIASSNNIKIKTKQRTIVIYSNLLPAIYILTEAQADKKFAMKYTSRMKSIFATIEENLDNNPLADFEAILIYNCIMKDYMQIIGTWRERT